MGVNASNFLYSLAKFLATQAGLTYVAAPSAGTKNCVFAGVADERFATDPYTVLNDYGGAPREYSAVPILSIQVATIGKGRDIVRARAWKMAEALQEANGLPLRMQTIDGITAAGTADGTWRLILVEALGEPGFVGGRDESGRERCLFNVDVTFVKLT